MSQKGQVEKTKTTQKWRIKRWAFKNHFGRFNNQKEIAKEEKDQDTIKDLTENTFQNT